MDSWNLNELDVLPRQPEVLDSESEGRAIHQPAHVDITTPAVMGAAGGPGLLAIFDPQERHEVQAVEDSRILLLLSPWPGDGHPSQPEEVRERSAE